MPAPDTLPAMPEAYPVLLSGIKAIVVRERLKAVMSANAALVLMYWEIGRAILERQQTEGWGARVIDRLSHDLKAAFPDMSGFSPRNLQYMRKFAEAWPDRAIVQPTVAQLPWRSNQTLLDKLKDPAIRFWYAQKALELGMGKDMLFIQIETRLYERQGKERCYVLIELKAGKFEPGHVSKLNMYLNAADDLLRHPDNKPSIGLLLVRDKNQTLVEYSLAGFTKPIGVAQWERRLTQALPADLKTILPSVEEIEAELDAHGDWTGEGGE